MSDPASKLESAPSQPTRQSGDVGSGRYALAWLAIWLPSHMTTLLVVSEYLLDARSRDGFAAMMGMLIWLYPTLGILASYFVAKITRRNWTFLLGAAVVGFGVGIHILAAYHWGVPTVIVDSISYAFLGLAIGGVVMVFRERARPKARSESWSAQSTP